jgi:hypothetical protein
LDYPSSEVFDRDVEIRGHFVDVVGPKDQVNCFTLLGTGVLSVRAALDFAFGGFAVEVAIVGKIVQLRTHALLGRQFLRLDIVVFDRDVRLIVTIVTEKGLAVVGLEAIAND